jgi:hypothetical protein
MGTVLARATEPSRGCACANNVQQKRAAPRKLQNDLMVAVIGAAVSSNYKERVVRLIGTNNNCAYQAKVEVPTKPKSKDSFILSLKVQAQKIASISSVLN